MKNIILIISILLLSFSSSTTNLYANSLKADAVVESQNIFTGESFVFQIHISGSESPEKPDLSQIKDFKIFYQGGQNNSSHSVTIINGHRTEDISKGYFFSYKLTPKKAGTLTIPAITIKADGQKTHTQAIQMHIKKPIETDDFKLRLTLSKNRCYKGEAIILTCTLYLNESIRELEFNLPLLEQTDNFYFANPKIDTNDGNKYYQLSIGNEEVVAKSGNQYLNGHKYSTISFKKILIPKITDTIRIEPALADCTIQAGYQKAKRDYNSFFNDDMFSDFFGDSIFGSGRRRKFKKLVVPSNSLTLEVLSLPSDNCPEDFEGHIGEYNISTIATPTDVSVGDPITLKIILRGPQYLEHIKLPTLSKQSLLIKNFKIPDDIGDGEVSGNIKVFTQTIRALNSKIKEIPPIYLSYFDTKHGRYQTIHSNPIPLTVKETKVITVDDAEGIKYSPAIKNNLEIWSNGIAYNYDDMSVLKNQYYGILSSFKSVTLLSLIIFPPIIYFITLLGYYIKNRYKKNSLSIRSKKAYKILNKSLLMAKKIDSSKRQMEIILNSFKTYLSDKLLIPKGGLTFNDVKDLLIRKNINDDTLKKLNNIFSQCEQGRYAGYAKDNNLDLLFDISFETAKKMEKQLK